MDFSTSRSFCVEVVAQPEHNCCNCICSVCHIAQSNGGAPGCGNCDKCNGESPCNSCHDFYVSFRTRPIECATDEE